MTNKAQKMQMKKECIEKVSLALGRQVTPAEGSEMLANVRAAMLSVKRADPTAWESMSRQERIEASMKAYQESVKAQAEKIKQRAYLAVLAQANVERSLATHRARGYRGYSAGLQVLSEVDRRVQAAQAEAVSDFLVQLDGKQKGLTGLFEDRDFRNDVVREVYGVDSGSQIAKDVAKAWNEKSEALRLRFNAAGGNLGKIENYIPQTHDTYRIRHAAQVLKGDSKVGMVVKDTGNYFGSKLLRRQFQNTAEQNRSSWVEFVMPMLDRERYIDLNGNRMGDDDLKDMLNRVFDTITQNGAQDFEGSVVAGQSAGRANRGDQHRALHFKDAESFLKYNDAFGHGTIFDSMVGSIRRTAKDTELLESLGPNPNNTVRGVERVCQADADKRHGQTQGIPETVLAFKAGVSGNFFKAAWSTLNGDASAVEPSREVIAGLFGGARNIEVFSKLQSTFLASISDIPTYFISAGLNKVPVLTATRNLVLAWGKDSRDIAARAGLMADALASNLSRWGANNVGSGWTGMLANATMKYSLLDAYTNGVRQASMINMMGTMADLVKHDWNSLEAFQKTQLNRIGVTEKDWKIWQAAKPYEQGGARYLTRQDIREVYAPPVDGKSLSLVPDDAPTEREIEHAVTSYMTFLRDESGMASLAPDLGTRAISNIAGPRGTFHGEIFRSFMLFKSFPIGFMRRHLERFNDLTTPADRLKYAAAIITSTTLAGAISVQLKALAAGRDLQDMESQDFWLQAASTGGGAGFVTDLIVAGMDGENAYGSPNVLRFLGPVEGSVLDAWDLGKSFINEAGGGLYNRKSTTKAKALRFVRGHLPFVNLWYLKGIVDRAVYNDLMEAASPGYNARVQGWARKNLGQEFWWNPRKIVPKRAPRIAKHPKQG